MSPQYPNPPLIEAVCEFRFQADPGWDATVPGRLYRVRGVDEVERMLREQPAITPLLGEAAAWITAAFGHGTTVVLEDVTDPDDEDDRGTLDAFIETELGPEQVRPQMRYFRDIRWAEASARAPDTLNFALHYV